MDTVASNLLLDSTNVLLDSANALLDSSNVVLASSGTHFFDSYIMPLALAFIGTAAGAFAAFALERIQKRKETRDRDFMAGQ